jgi:arylsulfatase A-like enzyme
MEPNNLFIFMDNLGYGEVGCYGGGLLRGRRPLRGGRVRVEHRQDGKGYASRTQLGKGSFFGRRPGAHAARR